MVNKALATPSDMQWINNEIKLVKRIQFVGKYWLLVQEVPDNFYVVCESDLDPSTLGVVRSYFPFDRSSLVTSSLKDALETYDQQLQEIHQDRAALFAELQELRASDRISTEGMSVKQMNL